jgi:CRP/FNR family transcriptional regulator, cyclic AMP receptor protein
MGKSGLGHAGKPQKHALSSPNSSAYVTLFGQLIAEPLRHPVGQYPHPARLSECHLRQLQDSKGVRLYPKGRILFEEGAPPVGAFVVLKGRVKKSLTSSLGKALVLGFFGPGTALGLAANILESPHDSTAEAIQETQTVFVRRHELIKEMRTNPIVALQIAQLIGEDCRFLTAKLGAVELADSAAQKMARCLLGLVVNNTNGDGGAVHLDLNQETIAQMVGLARETVSRLLSRFRRQGLLDWTRSAFVIRNRRALERLADFPQAAA